MVSREGKTINPGRAIEFCIPPVQNSHRPKTNPDASPRPIRAAPAIRPHHLTGVPALQSPMTIRYLRTGLLIALAYAGAAQLGVLLALPPGNVSAIFPAAGVALAAVLVWPQLGLGAVFAGALLFRLGVAANSAALAGNGAASLFGAVLLAGAATLQARVGADYIRRSVGYPMALDDLGSVLRILIGAPLTCLVGATLSVAGQTWLGQSGIADFSAHWAAWWLSDTLGVIAIFPLAMGLIGAPAPLWRTRRKYLAVATLIGVALPSYFYSATREREQQETLTAFHSQSDALASRIQVQFQEQEFLLNQMDDFLSSKTAKAVTWDEFRRFTERSLTRFPMVQAMEWAPRIAHKDRSAFEKAQQQNFPGYALHERNPAGQLVPELPRDEYYPVAYVEPVQSNQAAIGYDLGSSRDRHQTIVAALASNHTVATPPLKLVQEKGQQSGILLMQKVSTGPSTPGVVLTVLRVGDFVRKALPSEGAIVDFQLFDVTAGKSIYGDPPAPGAAAAAMKTSYAFSYGGRDYSMVAQPTEVYLAHAGNQRSLLVLAAMIFAIALLQALVLLGTGNTARIQALVEQRTRALDEENLRNQLFLRNSSDGIHILDADGQLVECSASFPRMLGYSMEEIKLLCVLDWDVQMTRPAIREVFERSMQAASVVTFETRHRCKDGHIIEVEISAYPIHMADRDLMFNSARDITERKLVQQRIQDSEARFKDYSSSSSDWFWEMDASLRYSYFSDNAAQHLGCDPAQLLGCRSDDVRADEEKAFPEKWASHLQALERHAALRNFEYLSRSGLWYSISGVPHFNDAGRFLGYRGTGTNISARKKTETALLQATQAAQAANIAKSRFLATMSHEIRTPLNGILGMAQLLVQPQVRDAEREDYAQVILNSGKTLLNLLNDILDLSKVEAGKFTLESVPVELPQLIHEIETLFTETAVSKGLLLQSSIAPHLGARAYLGDPLRLRQMLANLVSNAIKFTAHGSVQITVSGVASTPDSSTLEFSVADTGMGVPADQQALLFQPFSQADSSTTRQFGGSGLGLSIVRGLAQLMHGSVGIESQEGSGSRFWFRVRLAHGAAITTAQLQRGAAVSGEPGTRQQLTGHVLVVEDNAINRKVVGTMLNLLGPRADMVEDGQQAVQAIEGGARPDLILMDLQMPVLNGFDAARAIRDWEARHGRPRIPIVALSADAFEEDRQRCREVGMDDFMAKPVEINLLLGTLQRWLGQAATPGAAPGATPGAERSPVVNIERMLDQFGHDASLAQSIVQMTLEDFPAQFEAMEQALATRQWDSAKILVHTAKGLAAQIGALRLAAQLLHLDTELKAGKPVDVAALQEVRADFAAAKIALTRWMGA